MKKNIPAISVVIPVKNEAAKIRACMEGILSQSVPVLEIIVVDSGSTDGTVEILKEYEKVKVFQIPSHEFNHGDTRNYGVSKAAGEFVLLTVGDSRAYDQYWIQHMLEGFDDPLVAGVCGQQVVPHEKENNPISWFRPQSDPGKKKFAFTKEEFDALPQEKRKEACGWDDVSAMYRRSVLQEIPFRRTSFCEDAIWAKEALLAGYTIVYNAAARVYHYHLEDNGFTFKQCFTIMYYRYRYLNYLYPSPSLSKRQKLSLIKQLWQAKGFSVKEKWGWFQYNINYDKAMTRAYGKFMEALNKSETALDEAHYKFCNKPPIPLKKKANEPALS